jgi:transmembrane sensor
MAIVAMPNEPLPHSIRDQAVNWFLRLKAADVTDEERRQFLRWHNAKPEHKLAYDNIERHWQWMEPLKTLPFAARDQALNYQPKSKHSFTAYAAAAMLVLSIGLSVYWQQTGMIFPKTYQVAKGELAEKVFIDLAEQVAGVIFGAVVAIAGFAKADLRD